MSPSKLVVVRRRNWATSLFFKEKKRKLPKTFKDREFWCVDHRHIHKLRVYATWIWITVDRSKRINYDAFFEETLRAYEPHLMSNFMAYRMVSPLRALMGLYKKPEPQTPEHLSDLAKVYGYLG